MQAIPIKDRATRVGDGWLGQAKEYQQDKEEVGSLAVGARLYVKLE
jgi:hypothetical protein